MISRLAFGRPRGLRRVAIAALVTLLPAACASGRVDTGDGAAVAPAIMPGSTLVGNYLAGRHARATRDTEAAADFLLSALEKAPGDRMLMQRAMTALLLDGRISEALPFARQIAGTEENTFIARMTLTADAIATGRFDDAETELANVPDSALGRLLVPLLSAWVMTGQARTDDALSALAPMAKNRRTKQVHDIHAALINDAAGRSEKAVTLFEAALDTQTGKPMRLTSHAGEALERTGNGDKAAALYRAFISENRDTRLFDAALARIDAGTKPPLDVASAADGAAEAMFDIAGALARQNVRETSLIVARLGLHVRPNFPILQILAGDVLESLERLDSANAIYATIDRGSVLSKRVRLNIAVNLNQMNRVDEAVAELRALAKEQPNDAGPLIELGNILRGHERFAEAVDAYDGAVARVGEPERRHWSLLYVRGIALERSKQWDRAEADFLKALEFEPDQPYVLNYLGYSWVELGKNLDEALNMIRKAVSLRPNDGYIVDSLGWVYYRLGRYEEGVRELERAVELRPEDPVINDHLGDALWRVERRREARFQWHRALALGPPDDLREKIEKKIESGLVKEARAGADD